MSAKMQPIKAAPSGPPTRACSAGDCNRICEALGMSLGICHSPMDDSRGLAFTVCGGMLTDGTTAPAWIARMNGWSHEEIAADALARDAVRRSGRYRWESLPIAEAPAAQQPTNPSQNETPEQPDNRRGDERLVRCAFGTTRTTGAFKGDMYECGAKAAGDYYDKLYKCRRPICLRHLRVVERNDQKWGRNSDVRRFQPTVIAMASADTKTPPEEMTL